MKQTASVNECAVCAVVPRIRNAGSWPITTGNPDNLTPHNAAERGTNHDYTAMRRNLEMEWKDATSYSKDETDREPRSWSFQIDPTARVVVTKGHIYYPGEWITHFYPMYENRRLNMPADQFTAEQAQDKALALAEGTLMGLLRSIQSHLHETA